MKPQNTRQTAPALADFHAALHAWYATKGRRGLPWRNTANPYHIWLSEVMLQQTQVATVLKRFYFPFLEQFPTLQSLAAAPREDVLKAWQGLGYYTRAANLHKAAQASVPALPNTVEALLALPGIGRNTAHAVAAFAFRRPVPVMEANVKRVLCRIFALENPPPTELWNKAAALLDIANPFDYNQAMMDVGAMLCTPRAPKCGECPANIICQGQVNPETYPARKAKKPIPTRRQTIYVLRDADGRYFAEPRTTKFLGGMFRFIELDEPSSRRRPGSHIDSRKMLMEKIPACAGMTMGKNRPLGSITHTYSHFHLEAEAHIIHLNERGKGNSWYTLEELKQLPHSRSEEKILVRMTPMFAESPPPPARRRGRSSGGRNGP